MRRSTLRRSSTKNAALERNLAKAKEHVRWRANGMCEAASPACPPEGRHRGFHVHHIQPRSHGVDHSAENLLLCCFDAHDWIHAHPAEARVRGLLA